MSIQDLKTMCKKWNDYYIFGREPNQGIKNLLFSINDLCHELVDFGTIEKLPISQEDFSELVLCYVFDWNKDIEIHIHKNINYILNI